jgi:outer membrane protein assembly factor BamB
MRFAPALLAALAGLQLLSASAPTGPPSREDRARAAELPPEQAWAAEEVLAGLAGPRAPDVPLGGDEASRQSARRPWADWWRRARNGVDLVCLDDGRPLLGYTLIVQQVRRFKPGFASEVGEVVEVDAGRKVRWRLQVEGCPVDARVVGPGRVLVTELHSRTITERDTGTGKVVWQYNVRDAVPSAAQRLANGNTFVVTQNSLVEVSRKGDAVWAYHRPGGAGDVLRAVKPGNGDVVVVTGQGMLTRLAGGSRRCIRTFYVGQVGGRFGCLDVLPGGNVLVPLIDNPRLVEFNPSGKEVWQADNPWPPTSVQRLPNGHVLVSSTSTRQILELDRSGRPVWTHNCDGLRVILARRR